MKKIIEDTKTGTGRWVKSRLIDGVNYFTRSGLAWSSMRSRCNAKGAQQRLYSRYVGCTMSEEFSDFQSFTDWHRQQPGYALGYSLDKDILTPGNKLYSADTCALVPSALNNFLCAANGRRGAYPQGVYFDASNKAFKACISLKGKSVSLGYHATPELAHEAYKRAKEAEARAWADRLQAGEFLVDSRVIERMRLWTA